MIHEIDSYIDKLGGNWTLNHQYLRSIAKLFHADIRTTQVYQRAAEEMGSSYCAVQRGAGRAAEEVWETGKELLRKDLERPNLTYPGPQALARWIARAVAKNTGEW